MLSNLSVNLDKTRREVVRMLGADRAAVAHEVAHPSSAGYMQSVKVRVKVKALEVYAHCGVSVYGHALPQTLLVNLEYVYTARSDDEISGVLMEDAAQVLEREEIQLLETGTRRVEEHVLERFLEVWKPAVRTTKVRFTEAGAVSGVPVEATSGR